MKALGLKVNPTVGTRYLSFIEIAPLWLRELVQAFLRYNIAVHSPGDCFNKLQVCKVFARYMMTRQDLQRTGYIDRSLVNQNVVATIQAQQQEIHGRFGSDWPYLFPRPRATREPFQQSNFARVINKWAIEHDIRDRNGSLWRFQSHQFRHTVGMRLINDDVPLEVISRLFGHDSTSMTGTYARKRAEKIRQELERVQHNQKTVDYEGRIVKGDPRANDPDAQMVRKGVRGQTLAVGGCGRLIVLGDCNHANKCLTCPMWLTSSDDLSALKSFYKRAVRLTQLRADLVEAENGLEEAKAAGLILAVKHLERNIADLKTRIMTLEETI